MFCVFISDNTVLSDVNEWQKPLEQIKNLTVGTSYVLLNGERATCRVEECNMGKLVLNKAKFNVEASTGKVIKKAEYVPIQM